MLLKVLHRLLEHRNHRVGAGRARRPWPLRHLVNVLVVAADLLDHLLDVELLELDRLPRVDRLIPCIELPPHLLLELKLRRRVLELLELINRHMEGLLHRFVALRLLLDRAKLLLHAGELLEHNLRVARRVDEVSLVQPGKEAD